MMYNEFRANSVTDIPRPLFGRDRQQEVNPLGAASPHFTCIFDNFLEPDVYATPRSNNVITYGAHLHYSICLRPLWEWALKYVCKEYQGRCVCKLIKIILFVNILFPTLIFNSIPLPNLLKMRSYIIDEVQHVSRLCWMSSSVPVTPYIQWKNKQ